MAAKRIDKRRKVWTHSKFKKTIFNGSYEVIEILEKFSPIDATTERVFMLTSEKSPKNGSFKRVSFESPEAAKAAGWKSADRK